MIRMATAAAVLTLSLAMGFSANAAPGHGSGDAALADQIAAAEASFDQNAFERVVETLAPAVQPEVFATLSDDMQYETLGLYARALFRLGAWDDAHDAFVDLTENPNATPADWAYRYATAEKVGDSEDATLAREQLEDEEDDGLADPAPVA